MNSIKFVACVLVVCAIDRCEVDGIFNGLRVISPHTYKAVGWIRSNSNTVSCGAVLIALDSALTAASCVTGSIVSVYFGDHNRSDTDGREQVFSIASSIIHPDYNSKTHEYDVAILVLDGAATFTQYVGPTYLNRDDRLTNRILGKHCRVVGWGYVDSRYQSDVPYEITVDNTTCTDAGAPTSAAICYEPFRDPTALTCRGDTGGAYLCKRQGSWNVAGIMSAWNVGKGCTPGSRAVTTAHTIYDWVQSNLGAGS